MNKYKIILIIAVILIFCYVPAFAVNQVIPAPPSWVVDEEYVVFEYSAAYEPEMWDMICTIRKELEGKTASWKELDTFAEIYADENDAGLNFEIGLLYYKLYK